MNHKQEIGNYGRRYNTINEIARNDRKLISNLYGVDIATALQTILLADMKQLAPSEKLPLTTRLTIEKNQIRKEALERMKFKDISTAKMEITAIYQGRWYKPYYKPLKKLFDERDLIAETVIKQVLLNPKSARVKYATERTNQKLREKFKEEEYSVEDYEGSKQGMKQQIRNSFLFYYWTFKEREIQNMLAREFKYPLTLHDAVYTQDIEEFKRLNIQQVEDNIFQELQISIKLEVE